MDIVPLSQANRLCSAMESIENLGNFSITKLKDKNTTLGYVHAIQ